MVGDVILAINGVPVHSRADAQTRLLDPPDSQEAERRDGESGEETDKEEEDEEEGRSVTLSIRRGLAKPYCSHPRLDLFVGSLSPHPVAEFGCTI